VTVNLTPTGVINTSRETAAPAPMRMTISKVNFYYGTKQTLFDVNMSVAANRVGVDRTAVRMPMVSVSGLQSTPVRDLGSITPAWRQNTFLYNALGPDLYNDILVNKTVPSSFGWL